METLIPNTEGLFWARINENATRPVTFTWAFDDGSPDVVLTDSLIVRHTFSLPRNHTVTVTASNLEGSASATCNVRVLALPDG